MLSPYHLPGNLKIAEKGENAENQHLCTFFTMFSTHPETRFNFSIAFILSSANAFSLVQSKILSFGKEVKWRRKLCCSKDRHQI